MTEFDGDQDITASTLWIPVRQDYEKPETLVTVFAEPEDVKIFDGFKDMAEAELKDSVLFSEPCNDI